MEKMYTSRELNIGKAGQHLVLADLLLRGVSAYPTDEGVNYDVVFDWKGKLNRLQVKSTLKKKLTRSGKPIYFFHVRRGGKRGNRTFQFGEFEGFALVALDVKQVFYLPFTRDFSRNSVTLRDRNFTYGRWENEKRGHNFYLQDLTWENFISELK